MVVSQNVEQRAVDPENAAEWQIPSDDVSVIEAVIDMAGGNVAALSVVEIQQLTADAIAANA